MTRPLKNAVIYARKSTDDRKGRDKSHSVEEQLESCRKLASDSGYTVIGEFYDDAFSGRAWPLGSTYDDAADSDTETIRYLRKKPKSHKRRPAFGKTCDLIIDKKVDVILVRESTRLARPKFLSDFINWLPRFLWDNKTWVHSVLEGELDPTDRQRLMYKIFQDAIIDDELTKRAEAAQTAKKKLNKKGWWTAQAPYGYCKTEASKVYKQAPERAQVVRRMFQTILRGEGIHAFVRKINAEGKTTAKGNLWRLGRFQTAVRNPLYAGLMNVGTKEHPVLISCRSFPEPIITENEWRTAQKIIRGRSQLPTASQTSYPCSGLVFCGDCGRRMQVYGPNKKPEWRKYWCDGSYTVSTDETCKATVNMEDLHAILRHFGLLKSYYDEQVQAEALKSRERLPQLYQRRDELTARLGKLNSKVGDEETDFDFWREAMTNLKIEIDEQTAEIQELEAIPNKMVRSTYDNFVDALALNRPENRGLFRDVIRSLIERIEVTTEAVTIKLNDGYSFPLRRGKKTHKYHRELPKIHVMPTLKGTKLHLSIVQDEPILEPYVQAPNLLVDEIHPEQAQDWPE